MTQQPPSPAPPRRRAALSGFVAFVTVAGAAAVGVLAATDRFAVPAGARVEALVLIPLFFVAYGVAVRPGRGVRVTAESPFTLALLFVGGPGVAVATGMAGSLVHDVLRGERSLAKLLFNTASQPLALVPSALVFEQLAGTRVLSAPSEITTGSIVAMCVAGVTYVWLSNGLTGIVVGLDRGATSVRELVANVGVGGAVETLVALAAPVAAGAVVLHPLLALLVALPVAGIYRSERFALANEQLALHDGLTGLPNRMLFMDRVNQAIREHRRTGGGLSVLMVDLNGFKEVNDTLGHRNGDQVLRETALRIARTLRESDTAARLGGDEFALLLPHTAGEVAGEIVADKVIAALRKPIAAGGVAVDVGASVGLAVFPDDAADAEALIARADVAMYAAKASGVAWERYTSKYDPGSPERLQLAAELRAGIAEGELTVHYQPLVELSGAHRVVAAEALVRWRHPRRGLLPPGVFLPLAEQGDMIRPLTAAVLEQAIADCAEWQESVGPVSVSVNISTRSLIDRHLPGDVDKLLRRHRLPPSALILEITETSIMADPERAVGVLRDLHQLGVSLAIDDFGTGYSSLAYLQRLPVDKLKIDRSFVGELVGDAARIAIVRSTVSLGHSLRMTVIAEGIEDDRAAAVVSELGCDWGQGYLWSPPLPADEAARFMADHSPQAAHAAG